MPTSFWLTVLLLVPLLTTGCYANQVRQSSLVPSAALPPPPSFRHRADVYVGNSSIAFIKRPELAANEEAGLWIPRHQLDGAISVRLGRWVGLRLNYRHGFSEGAIKAADTTLQKPDDDVFGVGTEVQGRIPIDKDMDMFLSFGTTLFTVPSYLEIRPEFCDTCVPERRQETEQVMQFSFGGAYRWRVSQLIAVWGMMNAQTHPTNRAAFSSSLPEGDVETGPMNLLFGAGAELEIVPQFHIVPMVQVPVFERPIRYGPLISVGLRGSFGSTVVD